MSETILVPLERAGLELDEFLCLHFPEFGKGFLRQAVREGRILLDGMPAQPSVRLRVDQVLIIELDDVEPPPAPVAPEAELAILHEDEDVIVVDKPAGLAVEPERWARSAASLAGALLALARGRSGVDAQEGEGPLSLRLRAVHRLDKDTTGALVVAKHIEAERFLRMAFEEDRVRKTYFALVEGEHPLGEGAEEVIDLPLGPDPRKTGRMVIDPAGKPSRTRIAVEQRFRGFTWMRCQPETGRTHQIRVHLSAAGFPLAVDPLYGRRDSLALSALKAGYRAKRGQVERPLMARLTLHAARIELPTRSGGAPLVVNAPLPKDLEKLLKQLGKVRAFTR